MSGLVIAEIVLVVVFLINVILYYCTGQELFMVNAAIAFILLFIVGVLFDAVLRIKFFEFLGSGGLG